MTILEKANQILADKEANLLPENLRQGITCLGVDGTLIELVGEEKSVIATTEEQEITPAEGYNGITKIVVRPVTNAIDENIKAENIKIGETILGVEGSYIGEILIYDSVDALPADATSGNLAIVETNDTYSPSTLDTVFDDKIHLPEEIVFAENPGSFQSYIGIKPLDENMVIDNISGNISEEEYVFSLQVNGTGEDTLEIRYTSADGLTYTRAGVTATGIFSYDEVRGILDAEIDMIPCSDEALGDVYNNIGGLIYNTIQYGGFAGVYQFGETGWVRIDLDTSNGTATANDIIQGKGAYVNGELVEGAIHNLTGEDALIDVAEDGIVLLDDTQKITLSSDAKPDRYVFGGGHKLGVNASYDKLAEAIGLTPDKITSGNVIIGVEGTGSGTLEATELLENYENVTVEKSGLGSSGIKFILNCSDLEGPVYLDSTSTIILEYGEEALAEYLGITPDMIKAGETVLGIQGTYTGSPDPDAIPEEEF